MANSSKMVIAISGPKGSGKSTLSQQILDLLPKKDIWCTERSFATPIKEFLCGLGMPRENIYGEDLAKNVYTQSILWPGTNRLMTYREVMQYFGTDLMRSWMNNVWVDAMEAYIHNIDSGPYPCVLTIPDMRFDNELDMLSMLPIDIDRFTIRLLRKPNTLKDSHSSEHGLDLIPDLAFDVIVPDNLTVEQQREFIKPYVNEWAKLLQESK